VDQAVVVPMSGMVQSLNVSVAASVLLFEALRQRQAAGMVPQSGEGVPEGRYAELVFEWAHPRVAEMCRRQGRPYPALTDTGEVSR
jgi:tRNA (guanosine-2'-O-)-methyltransferase